MLKVGRVSGWRGIRLPASWSAGLFQWLTGRGGGGREGGGRSLLLHLTDNHIPARRQRSGTTHLHTGPLCTRETSERKRFRRHIGPASHGYRPIRSVYRCCSIARLGFIYYKSRIVLLSALFRTVIDILVL